MNGYLLIIGIYALLLIGVGTYISRRVKNADDYFVGGRSMGFFMLFITLIAPNIGAGSTVGVAGMGFTHGLSAVWWIVASALGTFVLAFIVGPRIWSYSKAHGFYTLGDYLEYRYNRWFRGLISLLLTLGTLAIFSGQLMGIAWILSEAGDINKVTAVIIAALVVVLYFGIGGFLATVYANAIEALVKFIGFAIAIPFVFSALNGLEGLHEKIYAVMPAAAGQNYFSLDGMGITAISGFFLMLIPAFFISPALIGKIYSGRSKNTVRIGTALCGLVMLCFAIVPVFLGMAAHAINPELAQQDLALPYIMKTTMPFWASALALAAIFSAEISAADAVLYMISTSFTKDLYKGFINPGVSSRKLILSNRIVTLLVGIIGIILAIILPDVISALKIFYALMSVSITAPLLYGLFTKRASTAGAFSVTVIGLLLTGYLHFFNQDHGLGFLNAQGTAMVVTVILMGLWCIFLPKKTNV